MFFVRFDLCPLQVLKDFPANHLASFSLSDIYSCCFLKRNLASVAFSVIVFISLRFILNILKFFYIFNTLYNNKNLNIFSMFILFIVKFSVYSFVSCFFFFNVAFYFLTFSFYLYFKTFFSVVGSCCCCRFINVVVFFTIRVWGLLLWGRCFFSSSGAAIIYFFLKR